MTKQDWYEYQCREVWWSEKISAKYSDEFTQEEFADEALKVFQERFPTPEEIPQLIVSQPRCKQCQHSKEVGDAEYVHCPLIIREASNGMVPVNWSCGDFRQS